MNTRYLIQPDTNGWRWLDLSDPAAGVHDGLPQPDTGGKSQDDNKCVLLVPAQHVFFATVSITSQSQKQLLRAIPFAVEEQLADDPQLMHFSILAKDGDRVHVAGVAKQLLGDWLEELAAAGIIAMRAIPDALLLPWQEGSVSAMPEGNQVMLRTGEYAATTIDQDLLSPWLSMAITEQEQPAELLRILGECDISGLPIATESVTLDTSPLALLARQIDDNKITLLHSEFSLDDKQSGTRSWKIPAMSAAAALLLTLLINLSEIQQLKSSDDTLAIAIESTFREHFPAVGRIQDPLVQAERELQRLRGGNSGQSEFSFLLGSISASVAASEQTRLVSLRFRNQQLQLELESSGIDELEKLQQHAQQAGLSARLESARLGEDGVSGTLLLERPQS